MGTLYYLFSPDTSNEVIRKRLLIDGDGAGDDRRINLLVKSFIKWCNSGSQEEGYLLFCFGFLSLGTA
uniref:Uncharacterized protein n=1 Tax=Serinus canaria TaxID=9135 RepID=A0A8C9MY34_SERCA